ncbi:hypothetical protein [Vibrio cionasavignyae]|uniref:cyanobactin maturation protease PatG family protein n=1 Tax=Vibrio cionasavignyae TaxID=2910252 RepID=UPI003D11CB0F
MNLISTSPSSVINVAQRSAALLPYSSSFSDDGAIDYVYVNGFIKAEFDNLGLEKEFERNITSCNSDGQHTLYMPEDTESVLKDTKWYQDRERCLFTYLSQPKNRYIARLMKWSIINSYSDDIYRLKPAPQHLDSLIAALKLNDNDVPKTINVIGTHQVIGQEPLPCIDIKKIECISPSNLVQQVQAQHAGFNSVKLKKVIGDILSLAENHGDTDHDRALNYALYHNLELYMGSYEIIYNHAGGNTEREVAQLNNVTVLSEICGERKVAKVVFDFQNVQSSVGQHWYCAIDVTDDYPFLLTKFKRYLPRY